MSWYELKTEMAVLLARRQARTFSTGLICEAWGGSGGDVIGNAQRSCAVEEWGHAPAPGKPPKTFLVVAMEPIP